MAAGSFGWNNMNMQDHHHQYLSHARANSRPTYPQIACRICHRVFFSTEALIDHIESHMIRAPNDNNFIFSAAVSSRSDQLLNLQQNPYFLSAARQSNSLQLRNPNLYPAAGNIGYVSPSSVLRASPDGYGRVPAAAVWMNNRAAAPGSGGGTRLSQVQEYWVPVTRPFLNQLEHALVSKAKPATAAVNIIESHNSVNSESEALDLSLKL